MGLDRANDKRRSRKLNPFLGLLLVFIACKYSPEPANPPKFDWQGHRGCRGLMPENSIPAMLHALDLGVNTLELDVVISADGKVVVSHEAFISNEICLDEDGFRIHPDKSVEMNVFAMPYAKIALYDCGSLPHKRFAEQKKMLTAKPLLVDLIRAAETHARKSGRAKPLYNIEIKSTPEGDGVYHPKPEQFVDLVLAVCQKAGIESRFCIQSFDVRTLEWVRKKTPEVCTAFLVEDGASVYEQLKRLSFVPDVYSPEHVYVDAKRIRDSHLYNMRMVPWTVNDSIRAYELQLMGVDGVITDYPDRIRPIGLSNK